MEDWHAAKRWYKGKKLDTPLEGNWAAIEAGGAGMDI